MKNFVRIPGEKINLCTFRSDDEAVEKYTKWINDSTINHWVGCNDTVGSLAAERDWANKIDSNEVRFSIIEKETEELIGNCSYSKKRRNFSLGILIGETSGRNKGYGTEAIKMLIQHCFEQCNAHRVYLHVVEENHRARKCYEKAGLQVTGREREVTWYDGEFHDCLIMDILEQEYFKK